MEPRSKLRISIGQWTALVAALALVLSLPSQRTTADMQLLACVCAILPVLLLVSILVDALVGIPCPGCARWTLRRLALARTYYCCSHCRGRYRRFGLGVWRDASGKEYDATFRGKTRARSWLGFVVAPDDGDSTTSLLLRNRRWRERTRAGAPATAHPLPQAKRGSRDRDA